MTAVLHPFAHPDLQIEHRESHRDRKRPGHSSVYIYNKHALGSRKAMDTAQPKQPTPPCPYIGSSRILHERSTGRRQGTIQGPVSESIHVAVRTRVAGAAKRGEEQGAASRWIHKGRSGERPRSCHVLGVGMLAAVLVFRNDYIPVWMCPLTTSTMRGPALLRKF